MTADNDKASDAQENNQQPQTRGGAADVDKSKGFGTAQPGGPFSTPEKEADEPKRDAPDAETT